MINLVVARDVNGVIGRKGGLPWHLKEDMAFFKSLTSGNAVIMGRKTYESIGRPLPNRLNIIITRDPHYQVPRGCVLHSSLEDAIQKWKNLYDIYIIGGGEVYREAMKLDVVDVVYVTEVNAEVEGDTYFSYVFDPIAHNRLVLQTVPAHDGQPPFEIVRYTCEY